MAKKRVNPRAAKSKTKMGRDELRASVGRGLGVGALINNSSEEEVEEIVKELSINAAMIAIENIHPNKEQPRKEFASEALAELSQSIKELGIIQPITVSLIPVKEAIEGLDKDIQEAIESGKDQYKIISGERRFRAAKMAGLVELPAYIRIVDKAELLEMALVENIQREDLSTYEIANTYRVLNEEYGLDHAAIAQKVGKSRVSITHHLSIFKLHPNIRRALENQLISFGHAKVFVSLGTVDYDVMMKFLDKVIDDKISVRELEKMVRDFKEAKGTAKPKKPTLPDSYLEPQNAIRGYFGTKKAQIKLKGEGKGQIIIPFENNDTLNKLLDLIDDAE